MRKKHFFGILFSLVMVLGSLFVVNTTALADSSEHTHTIGTGESAQTITFTKWESTNSLPSEEGNYYLEKDITMMSAWNAPTGTTNLCLNGHTIKGYLNYDYFINVNNGAVLNLFDEDENAGKITADGGLGVSVNNGTLNMYGGSVAECTWGAVTIRGGTFKMEGGSIQNNSWNNSGAGVRLDSGSSFIMNGGSINGNNCSANYGGGVYVGSNCTFEMNGGSIKGNTINGYNAYGGGVYVSSGGVFKMTGGSITENQMVAILNYPMVQKFTTM